MIGWIRLDPRTLIVLSWLLGCAPESVSNDAGSVAHAGDAGDAGSAGIATPATSAGRSGSVGSAGNGGEAARTTSSPAGAAALAGAGGAPLAAAGSGSLTTQLAAGRSAMPQSAGSGGAAVPVPGGCEKSSFALCEDFESGALDAQRWKSAQSKGAVTLDTTRGARGSHTSLHVHVDPGNDTLVGITETATFPALKSGLSARAFIYIPSTDTASLFMGDRHTRLIYAQGSAPSGEYALGIWNGGIIQNHYSKSDDSVDTKMLPPFDTWFCLEYELDSAAGNVKAYLNDVEITALRHSGWPATSVDKLMFGADRYGSFPVAEDLWFDDLAVDSAHIGCAR
jgi:hypothetical protein